MRETQLGRFQEERTGTAACPHTLRDVFLEPIEPEEGAVAPLTPFMRHVALQAGLRPDELENPKERGKFVLWFYDTYHRQRAPYRWPVPLRVLDWLNEPAVRCRSTAAAPQPYLTRFMEHVRVHHKPDLALRRFDDYVQFLAWFTYECIPCWNIPPVLVPDDLIEILNRPVLDETVPLTVAMLTRARMRSPGAVDDRALQEDALLLAISHESLTEALRAQDARLIPEFISRFWSGRVKDTEVSRFVYVAARAHCAEVAAPQNWRATAARQWFHSEYVARVPEAAVFDNLPPEQPSSADVKIRPPKRAIFVYRDHRTISGLSRAGEMAVQALKSTTVPVLDLDYCFGRNRMAEEYRRNQRKLSHAESALHILNINPEYVPECSMCHLSRFAETDYLIGQFYWELSDISSIHECGLSLVNEVWVASEYLRNVYAARIAAPVVVMGQAVEPDRTLAGDRSSFRLPPDAYVFLLSFDAGSGLIRKNPAAAIAAFRQAFPSGSEDVVLLIKTMNTSGIASQRERAQWSSVRAAAGSDSRIRIIDTAFSKEQMASLFESCDCYVSLHRSEGFGFGPAEAMARGKPVIVTAYSGVTDFCTPETGFLVDFRITEIEPGDFPYMDADRTYTWAEPNVDTAAKHMRELYRTRDMGAAVGQRARALMRERYSAAALAARYTARLAELKFI